MIYNGLVVGWEISLVWKAYVWQIWIEEPSTKKAMVEDELSISLSAKDLKGIQIPYDDALIVLIPIANY